MARDAVSPRTGQQVGRRGVTERIGPGQVHWCGWQRLTVHQDATATQRRSDCMKKSPFLVASALAAVLSMPLVLQAQSGPAPKPKFEAEKCYGLAKAGKNDCQTATSSCAGTSKKDGQGDAWIYAPAGTCEKLVGGSLKSKT